MTKTLSEILAVLREMLRTIKGDTSDRYAYSIPEFAARTGLSADQIYRHIDRGDLTAKYSGTKRLIPADEAKAFVPRLPDEDRGPL